MGNIFIEIVAFRVKAYRRSELCVEDTLEKRPAEEPVFQGNACSSYNKEKPVPIVE